MNDNEYTTLRDTLKGLSKQTLCYLISDMMFFDKIDITDINDIYINRLKEKIAEKDRIIYEADNCIFDSLAYDHMGKVDSSNVILEKVRWRYRYADTNKEALCEMFNYDPQKDKMKSNYSVKEIKANKPDLDNTNGTNTYPQRMMSAKAKEEGYSSIKDSVWPKEDVEDVLRETAENTEKVLDAFRKHPLAKAEYERGYKDGKKANNSKPEVNIDEMVEEFVSLIDQLVSSHTRSLMEDAYRKGIVDTLNKLSIKKE